MNLHNISKTNTLSKPASSDRPTLRPGQVVQGKVLKIYPENKAEIQLGGQRLIANLEVGLQVGAKYHFQVKSTSDVIQLKVLSEALMGKGDIDISRLLQQLGFKDSKPNIRLLENLIRLNIPFDRQQISDATNVLKNEKNKPIAIEMLSNMIQRKLPITTSIYHALSEVSQSSITDRLSSVVQQTNASASNPSVVQESMRNLEANLVREITALLDKPQTFKTVVIEEVNRQNTVNNQGLFRTLQGLGFIDLNVDYSRWVSDWNTFTQGKKATIGNPQPNSVLPFQLNDQALVQVLSRINAEKPEFTQAVQKFQSQWGQQLNFHHLLQSSLPKDDFNALQKMLTRDILPFLDGNQRSPFSQLNNSPNQLTALYQATQTLVQGIDLENLIQLMQKSTSSEQFLAMTPKQQFLMQQNQFIQSLGLDYEQQIANQSDPSKQAATVKGMLLQLMNNNEGIQSETQTKLLHLINGMQIQSVSESQTMIQAAIQIPAERLGLIKDIELEFEGKKNENGEINPDYCRILFYLNLGNLKETVIDMNIQQRKISLTVFNNHDEIKTTANLLKKSLQKNIESLDYELTTLQYKKMEEKVKTNPILEKTVYEKERQGVDYRI